MRRREYLAATGGTALGIGLAGCLGGGGDGSTGTLATQVTDQPGDIGDFESCVVTITEIRVKPAGDGDDNEDEDADDETTATPTGTDGTATDAEDDSDGDDGDDDDEDAGVETYDVDDVEADLVQLQDGETDLVAEQELETGEYEFLQLIVTDVDATLSGGGDAEVTTPGNAPLKFNQSFEIRADTRTVFTADFTPVKRGRSGSYLLKPVASGTEVTYE